ncbi:3-phosphoshikimate 1-carboxyvinyltransferase [Flavobacterium sp. GT3R68]|uniref:3-phosphoshikimate 1-carboxyvinyltransferase n=1 Tax=Flavobacterium sp. GT3R68 TaxID=2594437 RepID=UPI000F863459|nr:3-phosphoshikimate 1-carboxyvinyltransferase [Flavobacterium sp. GT3R68]RTY92501.1 3-phosphoshikimate 1-carboxyvinyltransferase [Flavobacterium sp. GSN2]TRW94127.1 3-phosphoshikimate 1-carboxyvinyltransferase [Flavobacterium sp. GT3R68]
MHLLLIANSIANKTAISITGSKSETNRLLLLQGLYPNITLHNISNSDDSDVMIKALQSDDSIIDIHHAGTAMRFLTAYFSVQQGKTVTLTGSSRMKERPIHVLVAALRQLGAEIEYLENENFPPIKIKGQKLQHHAITLKADVSSQYISALLLIAPKLEKGLELTLEGKVTSVPYIKMTLALLNEIGVETSFADNKIIAFPKKEISDSKITVESDWSSASYFYSIVALSDENTQITLSSYKQNSFQGDSTLAELYQNLGVTTTFHENQITLTKQKQQLVSLDLNLNHTPDLAQTIAVTCFGLGIGCHLTGLHTLKIKETDRLEALQAELSKLGASVQINDDSITIEPSAAIKSGITIQTYDDHRMAMAFAPLAIKVPIEIENAEVVSKSYPDFWQDLKTIGFNILEK